MKKFSGKKIFFIRHAKSSWDNPLLDDFDRPLNTRGLENAPKMAEFFREYLEREKITINAIISSPSVRTRETLAFFLEKFSEKIPVIFDESIYEAPYENIISLIQKLDNNHKIIIIVGHNPGILDASIFLTGRMFDNIPTCGIVEINFEVDDWRKISKNS